MKTLPFFFLFIEFGTCADNYGLATILDKNYRYFRNDGNEIIAI